MMGGGFAIVIVDKSAMAVNGTGPRKNIEANEGLEFTNESRFPLLLYHELRSNRLLREPQRVGRHSLCRGSGAQR